MVDGDADRPNFGWDTVEGANDYEGEPEPDFTMPVVTYDHDEGCSITGGYVYRGARHPEPVRLVPLRRLLHRVRRRRAGRRSDLDRRSPPEDVGNVVSFGELEDGELVLLTSAGVQRVLPR